MSWHQLPHEVKLFVCEWLPATGNGIWHTERTMWLAREDWMLRHTVHSVLTPVDIDDLAREEYNTYEALLHEQITTLDTLDELFIERDNEIGTHARVCEYITHAEKSLAGYDRILIKPHIIETGTVCISDSELDPTVDPRYNPCTSARHALVHACIVAKTNPENKLQKRDHAHYRYMECLYFKIRMLETNLQLEYTKKRIARMRIGLIKNQIISAHAAVDIINDQISKYKKIIRLHHLQTTSRQQKTNHVVTSYKILNKLDMYTVFGVPHGSYTLENNGSVILEAHARYGRAHHDTRAAVSYHGTHIWALDGQSTRVETKNARGGYTTRAIVFTPSVFETIENMRFTYHAHSKHHHNTTEPGDTCISRAPEIWKYRNRDVLRKRNTKGVTTITHCGRVIEEWRVHTKRKIRHADNTHTSYTADGLIERPCDNRKYELTQNQGVFEWQPNQYGHTYISIRSYRYDGEHYTITSERASLNISQRTLAITYTGDVYVCGGRYYIMNDARHIAPDAELVVEVLDGKIVVYESEHNLMINSTWTPRTTVWGDSKQLLGETGGSDEHASNMSMSREDDVITWCVGKRMCEQYNMTNHTLDTYTHDKTYTVHWSRTRAGCTEHMLCPGENMYADYVGVLSNTATHVFTNQLVKFDHTRKSYTYSTCEQV